jgi:phosphoglycolate phosphatase-like HAD superfamily hydrolase
MAKGIDPTQIKQITAIETIIFDLDGVITSEIRYWHTAKLTVWELLTQPQYLNLPNYFGAISRVDQVLTELGPAIITDDFIYQLKSRAVNSNWDLTYFVFGLHLIALCHLAQPKVDLSALASTSMPLDQQLQLLGQALDHDLLNPSEDLTTEFWEQTEPLRGQAVVSYLAEFAQQKLGVALPWFTGKALWQLGYENFQAWYNGDRGYQLPDDETVLPIAEIQQTLEQLSGFTLGIATGRPKNEVIGPLTKMGVLAYFDRDRVVTYDDVIEAETIVNQKLGKPHPFIIHRAVNPELPLEEVLTEHYRLPHPEKVAYIGDAGSDVVAAKNAGCYAIGVLTGFAQTDHDRQQKKAMLLDLGCDVILSDMTELRGLFRDRYARKGES